MSGRGPNLLFAKVVHEQVFFPLRPRFGVVAEQNVVEPEPQQFLRGQERHAGLFRRSVALALVAGDTGRDQICRGALAALSPRENVIERQVLGEPMVAAVLAAIAVADVDPCTLHCRFTTRAPDIHIMPEPNNGWDTENRRGRAENVVAVVLFDEDRAAKPQTHRPGNTDGAKRLVRKVQKQYSSCKQT